MHVDIETEIDDYKNIYGGTFFDKSGSFDQFFIEFEGCCLMMKSKDLKRMAVDAINHLMVNGHDFEFDFSDTGQKQLKETTK